MSLVAGVDFGTLSVRVSIFDSDKGRRGSATADYPLERRKDDPDHATQRHGDHLSALALAMRAALETAGVAGEAIEALAVDTTGSSVVAVGEGLEPLGDYYLWCDHRSKEEAARITEVAHAEGLEAIRWCGGAYSSEWGWAKVLHWLRHNPTLRGQAVTFLEHCDMTAALLCGITEVAQLPRSICAMGHKWMWNDALGGLPPEEFLTKVDPLLAGVRARIGGRYATSDKLAGRLCAEWAAKLGLRPGIPIPVGALDAHWDAVAAGVKEGDVVNVVGTSTCVMAIAPKPVLIPGVSGVVNGSISPRHAGIEAGLSACGDIFDAIARRANTPLSALSSAIEEYRCGQTGLLRLTWDNGDRTVLANPNLGGVTLGWTLVHSAADELFAAIEGTGFHTRIILERMEEYGTPIRRVINGGGIPQRNETLNRVYANVLNKPVLVPQTDVTSLGSAIFAFLAAGTYPEVETAQRALCPSYRVIEPDPAQAAVCQRLYEIYRSLYFGFGQGEGVSLADVLPALRRMAASGSAGE
ncbi:MAG: ribulokinase [Bryobacteraceae bacterium]|nr:ribulokinase [Bryobacteraceae bacterium]